MTFKARAQQFIQEEAGVFAPNGIITQGNLCTYFHIQTPDLEAAETLTDVVDAINKFNCAKLSAYSAINKVIRPLGLVLKQETIRSTSTVTIQYRILTKSQTETKIKSFRTRAKSATLAARELKAGYKSAISNGLYYTTPEATKATKKKKGRPAKYPKIPGIED